ncbi:MAG TPA: hypothetical protein P5204_11665, partial [Kiritimatiellia bacterium]|nr:hypothetical protein [Kiritimatiellia bacterium]
MKTTKIGGLVLSLALVAAAAAAAPYVELPNGSRVTGSAIRALANGDVNLQMEMGMRTFPKGTYVKAVADKPAEYDQAAAAIKAQKYDVAIKLLEGIVARFRYLSWDVEASKLLAQARMGAGDAEGAVKAYEQLFLLAPAEKQNPESLWGLRRAMLKAQQFPALIRQLDAVAAAGNRADAAR